MSGLDQLGMLTMEKVVKSTPVTRTPSSFIRLVRHGLSNFSKSASQWLQPSERSKMDTVPGGSFSATS